MACVVDSSNNNCRGEDILCLACWRMRPVPVNRVKVRRAGALPERCFENGRERARQLLGLALLLPVMECFDVSGTDDYCWKKKVHPQSVLLALRTYSHSQLSLFFLGSAADKTHSKEVGRVKHPAMHRAASHLLHASDSARV